MYRYDEYDATLVQQRIDQFRDQVARRLSGELSEDQFKPLRLQNGVYLQLHAYMLRVAIPYGTLSAKQLMALAKIADKYDRGYGHFTTRQNIQFNWVQLDEIADVLQDLAKVEMHAIQTSGNCIRNVTTDAWAGVATDEVVDPRPLAEQIRQWSTFQPEYAYLPRKFKIAVGASKQDRAALKLHDLAVQLHQTDQGVRAEILVGGGQGRTPVVAKSLKDDLELSDLLDYIDAVMRVYNRLGRRDNKYKARIKILVDAMGLDAFRDEVEEEFARHEKINSTLSNSERQRIENYFQYDLEESSDVNPADLNDAAQYRQWLSTNVVAHKQSGYRIVNISLKPVGGVPGDASSEQMRVIADLAERYSSGEVRVSHRQNLVLPYVKNQDVYAIYQVLNGINLDRGNLGLAGDMICCPGMDYCALATARSIPIAQQISERLADVEGDVGPLTINQSGCINACGHHHVANIGILGLERKGEEYYQISLGGDAGDNASIGDILGPGFSGEEIATAIEELVLTYLRLRNNSAESFSEAVRRLGTEPFKEALYETA